MDEELGGEKEGEGGRENLRLQAWQPRSWHRSLALGLSSLLCDDLQVSDRDWGWEGGSKGKVYMYKYS